MFEITHEALCSYLNSLDIIDFVHKRSANATIISDIQHKKNLSKQEVWRLIREMLFAINIMMNTHQDYILQRNIDILEITKLQDKLKTVTTDYDHILGENYRLQTECKRSLENADNSDHPNKKQKI